MSYRKAAIFDSLFYLPCFHFLYYMTIHDWTTPPEGKSKERDKESLHFADVISPLWCCLLTHFKCNSPPTTTTSLPFSSFFPFYCMSLFNRRKHTCDCVHAHLFPHASVPSLIPKLSIVMVWEICASVQQQARKCAAVHTASHHCLHPVRLYLHWSFLLCVQPLLAVDRLIV